MSNPFLELHGRIDDSLAVLATESDGYLRSRALHDMKTALDELDELLGLKILITGDTANQSPAPQSHGIQSHARSTSSTASAEH